MPESEPQKKQKFLPKDAPSEATAAEQAVEPCDPNFSFEDATSQNSETHLTAPTVKPVAATKDSAQAWKSRHGSTTPKTETQPPKWASTDPFFVELCAGSARVTSCVQTIGLKSSFGVDHKRAKNSGRLFTVDLTTQEGQALCMTWIHSPNCMGIFVAPPCGTCSRARGIPVRLPNGRYIPGPKPLRSDEFPDGVPGLSPAEQTRVNSANALYAFVTRVSLECIALKKVVCIENPRSSIYWRTTFFGPLRNLLTFTIHQACAYGSERPKWTALAHNTSTMHQLNNICPGIGPHHKHKPWGLINDGLTFSAAEETAYPMRLAFHIAFYLAEHAMTMGWTPPAGELTLPDDVSYQHMRSVTGVQPKASKLPPLVAEFRTFLDLDLPASTVVPVAPGDTLPETWSNIPAGACFLKKPRRLNGGDNKICQPGYKKFSFGIFHTPEQFIQKAVAAGHPVGTEARLPPALKEAVDMICSCSTKQIMDFRLKALKHWLSRAKALGRDEEVLHASLPAGLQDILAPKRLLLWKEMLVHHGYPDVDVFEEVVSGIDIAGPACFVPSFEAGFKPAKITESELAMAARSARVGMISSVRSSGDDFIDREVFAKTMEELSCGWLEGPFSVDELPDSAVISRRFGIKQGSGDKLKVRLIDDFSASGVNSTVQVECSAKLHTLDVAAALCLELLRGSSCSEWVGKTVDLSAAYRQLGVSPGSRWVSYIAVFDPASRSPKIFSMKALPFGASKSVYGFLRVAHSIWWLGCKVLALPWTIFCDDFITLARKSEGDALAVIVDQFFKLLGWAVSSGEKDLPFSDRFKALGVEIDLANWKSGEVRFSNTKQRVSELTETISLVLASSQLSHQDALSLRGRMQFAHSQLWGRSAKLCLNAVTTHAYSDSGGKIDDRLAHFLEVFKSQLESSRPRVMTPSWDSPMFVFTDASFSPESPNWKCGLGGVLLDSLGRQVSAFAYCLSPEEFELLGFPGKSTIIFEAEMLALIVGFVLWKRRLRNRPCVFYVDNNSARDVAISGRARTDPGSFLIAELLKLEDENCTNAWFARVPSASNIADGPSRNCTAEIVVKLVARELVCLAIGP